MGQDPLGELKAALGAAPPKGLAFLEPAQLSLLTTVVGDARRRQAAQLENSMEAALGHVPMLLRGTVKRLLRG